ncbi:MAG: PD40 domain-containing protein [Anaerolineales bacterium]|nr:PD40 domain-containing protein [Anaerolineales bacterium]
MKRRAEPELDWTFSAAPAEEAPALVPALPRQTPAPPPRPLRRWLLPAAGLLTLVLASSAVVYVRQGWSALETQVGHEIRYEDLQARAGAVDLVLALQSSADDAWRDLRAAETALGWPAPAPAPNLVPLAGPPQVGALQALGNHLFEATVTRRYADAAGRAAAFELTQRYRNLGPGLWERLPPDLEVLQPLATWTAPRLQATFPQVDGALLRPLLPRVEALLEQACRDWDCQPEMMVTVKFSSALRDLQPVDLPAHAADPVDGSYPIVFDLPATLPRYPPRLVWPAPRLAGLPHDQDAAEALVRALAAAVLANLAEQLSGQSRWPGDFFLDALVARAEIRLGLSVPPTYTATADDYVPIDSLWRQPGGSASLSRADALPFQRQALAFLEATLAGQPPAADGELLRALRQPGAQETGRPVGLVPWLEPVIGPGAAFLVEQRAVRFPQLPRAGSPFAWSGLEGMRLACLGGASLVRGGRRLPLPFHASRYGFSGPTFSPGGHYLAVAEFGDQLAVPPVLPRLSVYDLQTESLATTAEGRLVALLGWAADDTLLYWLNPSEEIDLAVTSTGAPPAAQPASVLMRYDPAAGTSEAVHTLDVIQDLAWSHDRTGLYITTRDPLEVEPLEIGWLPAGGRPANRLPVEPLVTGGRNPLPAPDGQTLAYVRLAATGRVREPAEAVVLYDLDQATSTPLVTMDDLIVETPFGPVAPIDLSLAAWSPDGQRLAITVAYGSSRRLFTIRRDGSGLTEQARVEGEASWLYILGFSADSRYLAYAAVPPGERSPLSVLDLETRSVSEVQYTLPGAAAWSPTGHVLALAGEDGVHLLDLATSRRRWVAFGNCTSVAW